MTSLLAAAGGRKFIAFVITVAAIVAKASFAPALDVQAIVVAAAVYIGAEGAGDVVSRIRQEPPPTGAEEPAVPKKKR